MKIIDVDSKTETTDTYESFQLTNETDHGTYTVNFSHEIYTGNVVVEISATDHLKVDYLLPVLETEIIDKIPNTQLNGLKDIDGTIVLDLAYVPEVKNKEELTQFLKLVTKTTVEAIRDRTTYHSMYYPETKTNLSISNQAEHYFLIIDNSNEVILEALNKNAELFDKMTTRDGYLTEIKINFDNTNFKDIKDILNFLREEIKLNIEEELNLEEKHENIDSAPIVNETERKREFFEDIKTTINVSKSEDTGFIVINSQLNLKKNPKILHALKELDTLEIDAKYNAYEAIEGAITNIPEDMDIDAIMETIKDSIAGALEKKKTNNSTTTNNPTPKQD
jgi:hypothetical protein